MSSFRNDCRISLYPALMRSHRIQNRAVTFYQKHDNKRIVDDNYDTQYLFTLYSDFCTILYIITYIGHLDAARYAIIQMLIP